MDADLFRDTIKYLPHTCHLTRMGGNGIPGHLCFSGHQKYDGLHGGDLCRSFHELLRVIKCFEVKGNAFRFLVTGKIFQQIVFTDIDPVPDADECPEAPPDDACGAKRLDSDRPALGNESHIPGLREHLISVLHEDRIDAGSGDENT
jgi:hypothetical protein